MIKEISFDDFSIYYYVYIIALFIKIKAEFHGDLK